MTACVCPCVEGRVCLCVAGYTSFLHFFFKLSHKLVWLYHRTVGIFAFCLKGMHVVCPGTISYSRVEAKTRCVTSVQCGEPGIVCLSRHKWWGVLQWSWCWSVSCEHGLCVCARTQGRPMHATVREWKSEDSS